MKSCAKCLIIVFLSVIVQVSSKALEEYKKIEQENIKLGTENAELRMEVYRLKGEIYNLTDQIEKFSIERENCRAFAENVDSISASLVNIQQHLSPLSKHFKLNKTKADTCEELFSKTLAENQKVMSESFKSFMEEVKSYVNEQISTSVEEDKVSAISNAVFNEHKMPKNCAEAANGKTGVIQIEIPNSNLPPFPVYCDSDNWMVILRRVDGTVDFERNWAEFKEGFGDIEGNFIMGLDKLHQVTKSQCHELKVVVEDFENNSTFALYDKFGIDDESNAYALKTLGEYSGTAGDSLTYHKGMKFTTSDRDSDEWKGGNCAKSWKGAWWYKRCSLSHLTGKYFSGGVSNCEGIRWDDGKRQCYSYKSAKIMIRSTTC